MLSKRGIPINPASRNTGPLTANQELKCFSLEVGKYFVPWGVDPLEEGFFLPLAPQDQQVDESSEDPTSLI